MRYPRDLSQCSHLLAYPNMTRVKAMRMEEGAETGSHLFLTILSGDKDGCKSYILLRALASATVCPGARGMGVLTVNFSLSKCGLQVRICCFAGSSHKHSLCQERV